jgi:L-cystine uptake protein TcyP (sodium:dicarboxylate symporter family)
VAIRVFEGADVAALERLREMEIVWCRVNHQIRIVPRDVTSLGVCVERLQPYTIVALRHHVMAASSKDCCHASVPE